MQNAISTTKASAPSSGMLRSHFWRIAVFQIVIVASLAFVVVTILAMFTYAGGTGANPQNPGYSFLTNFFSDLGRTVSHSGRSLDSGDGAENHRVCVHFFDCAPGDGRAAVQLGQIARVFHFLDMV